VGGTAEHTEPLEPLAEAVEAVAVQAAHTQEQLGLAVKVSLAGLEHKALEQDQAVEVEERVKQVGIMVAN
jgi:hypothetical protein